MLMQYLMQMPTNLTLIYYIITISSRYSQKLNDIFDNVIGDDYYLFGVNKDFSFIMSLLL